MILADQIESRVYVTGMDTKGKDVDASSRQKRDSDISGKTREQELMVTEKMESMDDWFVRRKKRSNLQMMSL